MANLLPQLSRPILHKPRRGEDGCIGSVSLQLPSAWPTSTTRSSTRRSSNSVNRRDRCTCGRFRPNMNARPNMARLAGRAVITHSPFRACSSRRCRRRGQLAPAHTGPMPLNANNPGPSTAHRVGRTPGCSPIAKAIMSDPRTTKLTSCTQPLGPATSATTGCATKLYPGRSSPLHDGNHREDDGTDDACGGQGGDRRARLQGLGRSPPRPVARPATAGQRRRGQELDWTLASRAGCSRLSPHRRWDRCPLVVMVGSKPGRTGRQAAGGMLRLTRKRLSGS